jgi:hypothetical protein
METYTSPLHSCRGESFDTRQAVEAEIAVAAVNLVGLALARPETLVAASIDSVYSLPIGIKGRWFRNVNSE